MPVPPAATPLSSVPPGRWVSRFYTLNKVPGTPSDPWYVEAAPSYYRVFLGSVLDFDGVSYDWNPPEEVDDWPPASFVRPYESTLGNDITRFRAVFEGTFDFGSSSSRHFGLTHTHHVVTYLDGVEVPALSGDGPTELTPIFREHTATLGGLHTIKVVFTMGERDLGEVTRARLRFLWEKCDGIDNNGNGEIDEDDACDCEIEMRQGKVYRFCDVPLTRAQAVGSCGGSDSTLVKIETGSENVFHAAHLDGLERWTGLNDLVDEGVWRWQDGSHLGAAVFWAPDQPDGGAAENCIALGPSEEWSDEECKQPMPFVCESLGNEVCDGVDNDGDGQADEGTVCLCTTRTQSGKTYRFCDSQIVRDNALGACAVDGSQLVKIETAAENAWIVSHMGFGDHWTGLNDVEVEGIWRWQDGTLLGTYKPWGTTEPNGSIFENCVELGPTGFWNDMACTASRRFVCEK